MMAAVAIGAYGDMEACIADWTTPLLNQPEPPDAALSPIYESLFPSFSAASSALPPIWAGLASHRARQAAA